MKSTTIITLIITFFFAHCAHAKGKKWKQRNQDRTSSTSESSTSTVPNTVSGTGIHFGFNAKGNLNTTEQVQLTDQMLAGLPSKKAAEIVIRVNGGTTSQKDFSNDWSDGALQSWASLQKKYGIRFVYVVNGNDSPLNQVKFIQRWVSKGVQFSFIEMMNEYYLPKFAKGDASKKEVGKKVTAKSYVDEILPTYFKELSSLNLPLFVICAPSKSGKRGQMMAQWNETVVAAMKKHTDIKWGVTLHLYKRPNEDFDYNQITDLRKKLPAGTPIAITEAGVLDKSGVAVRDHYAKIVSVLQPGDFLFDQVLYNNYKSDEIATLHPSSNGLTPKGKQVIEFYLGL
jgi:hypothetical protein